MEVIADGFCGKERNLPSTPPSYLPCAELVGEGRARLVVLAAEVGVRWSDEIAQFLRELAKARADSVPHLLQGRVKAAWLRRWSSLLACSAAS